MGKGNIGRCVKYFVALFVSMVRVLVDFLKITDITFTTVCIVDENQLQYEVHRENYDRLLCLHSSFFHNVYLLLYMDSPVRPGFDSCSKVPVSPLLWGEEEAARPLSKW